jgi:hypothetical protein
MERRVVGTTRIGTYRLPTCDIEVEPSRRRVATIKCGRQPPLATGWPMTFANVRDLHVTCDRLRMV